MLPAHAAAFEAYRRSIDRRAKVHGSCACGLADNHSDLDLTSSLRLDVVVTKLLHAGASTGFEHEAYIVAARVPRVLIRHLSTQVLVDVIEARSDPFAAAKDEFVRAWLRRQPEVMFPFAHLVRGWVRSHRADLPRQDGFPNSFIMLLSGVWYTRFRGGVPDSSFGCSQTEGGEPQAILFKGWLRFLAEAGDQPLIMDFGSPTGRGVPTRGNGDGPGNMFAPGLRAWSLVEPLSGEFALSLRKEQAMHLARLARAELERERG